MDGIAMYIIYIYIIYITIYIYNYDRHGIADDINIMTWLCSYKICIQLIQWHKPYSLNLIIKWLKIFNFYVSLSLSLSLSPPLSLSLSLSSNFVIFHNYSCGCVFVHIDMLSVVLANPSLPKGLYLLYLIWNHCSVI